MNTVEVNRSKKNVIKIKRDKMYKVRGTAMKDMDTSADQGEGLFVTRDIERGELVCFYGGRMLNVNRLHHLNRRKRNRVEMMYQKK